MAIPKKGSRSIIVDGMTYRWYVRRKPSYNQCLTFWNGNNGGLTFAVEHAHAKGSVLIVDTPHAHPGVLRSDVVPVVPSQVAHFINQALEAGWQPTQSGGAFHFKASE